MDISRFKESAGGLVRVVSRLIPQRRMVCIGHSHTRTVAAAARRQGVELTQIDFWTVKNPVVDENGKRRFRAEVADQLRGDVFSMVGGAAFNIMGIAVHPRRFDFILPSAPDLPFDPEAEMVPFGAVREALLGLTQEYLDLMGYVCDAAQGRVYHIEAPPPYPDNARMLPDIPWMFLGDVRREVSPRYFRYKMWRLHSEIIREFCDARGVVYIPRPEEVVDSEGFLLPQFYADPMHVNEAYGAHVLAQMRRAI